MFYNKEWKVNEHVLSDEFKIKAQGDVEALDTKEMWAQQHKEWVLPK